MAPMSDDEYRTRRRREWDEAGKRYSDLSSGALGDLMRQATAQVFEKAALSPGDTVLDVGTGHGSPALEAAAVVGPAGKVDGNDFAPSMVESARNRARAAGLANTEFLEMEAEALTFADDSFDAIVSRYGYPHFTNAVEAFRESRRVLRPGGRLAAAMHGAVEGNPYLTAPIVALARFTPDPAPLTDRGPFGLHAPDLLVAAMKAGGFDDAQAYAWDTTITVEDFATYWAAQKAGGAAMRRALDGVPKARRAEAEAEALAALAPFVTDNRAVFPAQIVIGYASKT